ESVDATVEDIFELQDELARRIVTSLRLKLTERDARDLGDARPATPEAYEYYLRANQLSYNSAMLASARDLYEACLERDPEYAPAWARLGRTLRVMAKYAHGDVAADYQRAEDAFRRALELDPELTVAHNLFTHFQIEQLVDAPGAMVRLLEQAARHPADPELFSGLVVACRFCGLLDASIAADRRARRLDPGVRTSVAYSYWMHADYTTAMRHDDEDMRYVTLYALPLLGRAEEALALSRQLEADRSSPIERAFATSARAALEGDLPACRDAVAQVVDSRFGDAEGLFHLARELAHAGDPARALAMLSDIVDGGLHCPETYEGDPWLAGVRELPGFEAVLARARAGRDEARQRFLGAGGDRLLLLAR
ncbi:MAG: tetratricopeptide repeat protein, partial [Planctomycetota bacterium]|nr:tetratricopeptide repeat protein [Planctomycetota bacterium]